MNDDYQDTKGLPTYPQLIYETQIAVKEFSLNWNKYPYDHNFTIRVFTEGVPNKNQLTFVAMLTLLLIFIRLKMQKPIRDYLIGLRFRKKDANRFPECLFRFVYYAVILVYNFYVISLSGRHIFYNQPCNILSSNINSDVVFSTIIPSDIQLIYGIQLAFYIFSVITLVFVDEYKKDMLMMLTHHILTILLISISYMARYYNFGCVIMLLHDISDVLLEASKLVIYASARGNGKNLWTRRLAIFLFFIFTLSWIHYRIYLYPLRVVHVTNWCGYVRRNEMVPRFYIPFTFVIVVLYIFQWIWFGFILQAQYRLVTGKKGPFTDPREETTDQNNNLKFKEE